MKKIWIIIIPFLIYIFYSFPDTEFKSATFIFNDATNNFKKSFETYKLCMSENEFNEEHFSAELINKKNEIISLYSNDANFMYTDLESNYSFGKGEDIIIYAASVTKLPVVLYVYLEADRENIDLAKEITYLSKHTRDGSGVIKNGSIGLTYSLKDLLEYAIKYSDNIAYFMILDEIGGTEVIKNYYENKGLNIEFTDNYGNLTPSLGNEYIKLVYDYYLSGNENSKKLISDMINSANSKYVKVSDIDVAHKYGEYVKGGEYYNDISLNFTTHPFALSITSTLGLTFEMQDLFQNTHKLAEEFNEKYHEEKYNYCKEKSQTF